MCVDTWIDMRSLFKVITRANIKLCVCVCVLTSSAVGHHGKLTAHVYHLLEESWTLPHHKPLIWNINTHTYHVPEITHISHRLIRKSFKRQHYYADNG